LSSDNATDRTTPLRIGTGGNFCSSVPSTDHSSITPERCATSSVLLSRERARASTQNRVTIVRISAPPGDQMRIVESLPAVAKNRPLRAYSSTRISAVWPLWTTSSTPRVVDPACGLPVVG